MKRRIGTYVAGACVAGLVAGMPLAMLPQAASASESLIAASAHDESAAQVETSGSGTMTRDMNVCLYGPPPVFEREPVQVLYGPPNIMMLKDNPMTAKGAAKAVKSSKAALRAYTFRKAITVKKAKGTVTFSKVAKGSSKALSVDAETGAVKLSKGAKKGLHILKVKVKASGNDRFAPAMKIVTVKVRVK